jgi:hypothetical protein
MIRLYESGAAQNLYNSDPSSRIKKNNTKPENRKRGNVIVRENK